MAERKVSTGRTAQQEADYQATGRDTRSVQERSGMSAEEFARGKAQNEAEKRKAAGYSRSPDVRVPH